MGFLKPEVLTIGGAWRTLETYGKLVTTLERVGHEVHYPRHPSLDQVHPPTASLSEDSDNIRAYVEKFADSGRRIVAVMHPYGGQVGTNSLVGLGLEARSKEDNMLEEEGQIIKTYS